MLRYFYVINLQQHLNNNVSTKYKCKRIEETLFIYLVSRIHLYRVYSILTNILVKLLQP